MSNVKTEIIVGTKRVIPNSGSNMGKSMVILTTKTGSNVWVPETQYDAAPSKETVTYDQYQKGDTFVATRDSNRMKEDNSGPLYLKGETVVRQSSGTQPLSLGKQVTEQPDKQYSNMEIVREILQANPNAKFALS